MPTAGIVTSGGVGLPSCAVSPRVPSTTPVRPAPLPWLKMIAPTAPASWALTTFAAKSQVPRCMSAMVPEANVAKSASSQPEVDVRWAGIGLRLTSTGWIVFVPVLPEAE